MTVSPLMRECSNCSQVSRCRFTGLRWICNACWSGLFPRGEAA